ncbi:Myb/SANT-like DNA-binding domain 4 [Dillenia turbinata]|uniref:Myb/SANT-like DNA-binding domain 4 n=1 Tax=Dillenia turbinata TaxID=194707 RepID=A0AAN8Z261_9MAGN
MALEANSAEEQAIPASKSLPEEQLLADVAADAAEDKSKTPRHPRWTRQETFVLIQGKNMAENRYRKGRRSISALGSEQPEPKWDSVSSYCKQHGVSRGPIQCRKRWSNLIGDFKKIKTWESQIVDKAESFWIMRNDLRKEKKLPGFFDKEVYDVLDGRASSGLEYPLTLVTVASDGNNGSGANPAALGEEEEEAEAVFDSGRHALPEDGLFSEFENSGQEDNGGSPEKETAETGFFTRGIPAPLPISGTTNERDQGPNPWQESISGEGWKRRRLSPERCQDSHLEDKLIKVLERNNQIINAQLEVQKENSKMDRDQRKDHNDSLVAALSKLTDALARIADKL